MSTTAIPAQLAIRKAGTADIDDLARVLALAFSDDPVFEWFFPDPADRGQRIEHAFREVFLPRLILPHDETYATDGELRGLSAWLPSEAAHSSTLESLRLLPAFARIFGRGLPRALRGFALMEKNHPHEQHYYLWLLATDPAHQGRGIGSSLLEHTLARNDSEGIPSYLEATSPRNRDLYLRHGFEITREVRFPDDGPPMWLMWRPVGAG